MEKAKRKKILLWVLIPLVSALVIAGIVIGSVMSCAPKDGNSNTNSGTKDPPDGNDDPPVVDPPHVHQWTWTYTTTEHWQYCGADDEIRNKGFHNYPTDEDTRCSSCGYERKLPTKQESMNVEFDEDGNAKISGADKTISDLVISGTVINPETNEEVEVVEITDEAFKENYNLHSLTILDGVKRIGMDAFYKCSMLESIWLPKTIEYIHPQAFQKCFNLKKIIIEETNPVYMSIYECIIDIAEKTIIVGCSGSSIPTRTSGSEYLVTSIGEYAFYGSGIAEIEIPGNIENIGPHAFDSCTALKKFTCLDGVTKLSTYALYSCTALTDISLGDSITQIDSYAISKCTALESITLPQNLKTIGQNAFKDCTALKEITFNDKLTGIDNHAFLGCTALESITLPASILGIGTSAFGGCKKLTTIIFAGTREQWEKVRTEKDWNPEGAEVVFADGSDENKPSDDTQTQTPDPDDSAASGGGSDN